MLKVWFNHWFSTAYNIIELLKNDNEDIYVIGSNDNEYSVIKNICDEWHLEPVINDEEYADFCLNFCLNHGVDVFIPRRGMLKISEFKQRFSDNGVKVMVDDYGILSILNRKETAYKYFIEHNIGMVPDYYIVYTPGDFLKAYEALFSKYKQICFKFTRDEGGKSFRLIDNQRKGYSALFKKQNTRMTIDDVMEALSERETFSPIMIMPFLPDDEVSVDCLETKQGLIMLPRVKGYSKYEVLRYDKEILALCENFQRNAQLTCPYNIQFKYLDGIPFFLEVNTRISGGIHMACYASGVNIPSIALNKLMGKDVYWNNSFETKIIGQVLQPVVLS